MWWLYQALSALLLLVAGPFLVLFRGRHYLSTVRGRLGLALPEMPTGALWIHAVSVGEVSVAATLVGGLDPSLPVLVTTITPTGQERARRLLAGRAAVAYAPFELGFAVRRILDRCAPRALILVEGDYWPLLLRAASRRGLPVAVINGRVSDRTFPRLLRFRRAVGRLLLDRVGAFGVQTGLDRERLAELGVPRARIEVTGNLKFEANEPAEQPAVAEWLERMAAGRPILVAGSTMPEEERQVLDAFAALRGATAAADAAHVPHVQHGPRVPHAPDALLVVAPRHPERFDAVFAEVARRFPGAVRRSSERWAEAPVARKPTALTPPPLPAPPPVAVLDSLGELAGLYRSAHSAFIGGTLVPRGGHNPIEAARFGVPVLVGPSMENFREIAVLFDRAGAWARIDSAEQLAAVWRRLLLDPAAAAELGGRGRILVESHRGALERTLTLLDPLLSGMPTAPSRETETAPAGAGA